MTKSRRALVVLILALTEIALIVALVAVALGSRLATISGWVAQLPGGRLTAAGADVLLLLIAAVAMTVMVSD